MAAMYPKYKHKFIDWIASNSAMLPVILLVAFYINMVITLVEPILPDLIWRADGMSPVDESSSHHYTSNFINRNGRLGFLGAASSIAQVVCSPLIGIIINRSNQKIVLLAGNCCMIICVAAYMYPVSYAYLVIFRVMQGVSICAMNIAAFSHIARAYAHDAEKRNRNLGMILFAYSVGTVVGPLFGSFSYNFIGNASPFAIIIGAILFCIVFQIGHLIYCDGKTEQIAIKQKPSNAWKVAIDPILLSAISQLFIINMDYMCALTFAPLRLIELSEIEVWKFGMVSVPLVICSAFSLCVVAYTVSFSPRWLTAFLALTISGVALTLASMADSFLTLAIVMSLQGFAQGSLRVSIHPIVVILADLRHNSDYASIYALLILTNNLGMAIGTVLGGVISYKFGTTRLFVSLAACTFVISYLCFALRNLKKKSTHDQEKIAILPKADCRDSS